MKTFNKTFLPDNIEYNGSVYTINVAISAARSLNNTPLAIIKDTLKKEGRKCVLVKVLPNTLKHRTDLHGRPYQLTEWIYTT